jgi:hypothetical protein
MLPVSALLLLLVVPHEQSAWNPVEAELSLALEERS